MAFVYQTGEEIMPGDHIRFHLELGRVDFVVEPDEKHSENQWYVQELGGGVMVLEPKYFGQVFLPSSTFIERGSNWEDLEFVSRGNNSQGLAASSEQLVASSLFDLP